MSAQPNVSPLKQDDWSASLFEDLVKTRTGQRSKRQSKKQRIIELYNQGLQDIFALAQYVKSQPSYVGTVLQEAGLIKGYSDLYTSTANEQNIYSRFFRNILSFKNLAATHESINRIDALYQYFGKIGDRAGQHQAQVLALTGRNRARWCGKFEEARLFMDWLITH